MLRRRPSSIVDPLARMPWSRDRQQKPQAMQGGSRDNSDPFVIRVRFYPPGNTIPYFAIF